MPSAETAKPSPTGWAVMRWKAQCDESCTLRLGRGGRKRAGNSTSPAAYSTYSIRGQILALEAPDCQEISADGDGSHDTTWARVCSTATCSRSAARPNG